MRVCHCYCDCDSVTVILFYDSGPCPSAAMTGTNQLIDKRRGGEERGIIMHGATRSATLHDMH
jgi:hypothetical protein